jgi:DNA-binding transcriptional ArsR family regulator
MLSNNVAHIARLIGDDTRASILIALMGGSALTAGELAVQANISAQTASNHLKKLTTSKLLVCEAAGRHRYYKLA